MSDLNWQAASVLLLGVVLVIGGIIAMIVELRLYQKRLKRQNRFISDIELRRYNKTVQLPRDFK